MIFTELYKKRGFHESLFVLYGAKNYSLTLPEFFERLEDERNSYYNAFFRVKNEMLKYGIILNKKSRNGEKVIGLTKKGVEIVRILKVVEDILNLDYEDYVSKMKKIKRQKASRQRKADAKKIKMQDRN